MAEIHSKIDPQNFDDISNISTLWWTNIAIENCHL